MECGHSVCRPCIKKHVHPFKKDSMILCEKCTRPTIATLLKESPAIDELVYNISMVKKFLFKNERLHTNKIMLLDTLGPE